MIRLAIGCFCAAFLVAADAQENVMSWRAIDAQIRAHWNKTYPGEKILSIENIRTIQSASMGRHGSIEVKEARVTVERTDGRQARFRATVHYRARMGEGWKFEHVWVERPAS